MDSFPMISRCWLAQWRGHTPAEQAWMIRESDRGHPTFFSLGHVQQPIWYIEHAGLTHLLMCVKIDAWPAEHEGEKP